MNSFDYEGWSRKSIYEFFKNASNPYYMVTFRQDVTRLYEFKKKNGISFYYALIYLCTKAINSVDAFKVYCEDGKLGMYDERFPSFTELKKGSDAFQIITMTTSGEDIFDFCRCASEKALNQIEFIDLSCESEHRIDISCIPSLDITAVTNERDLSDIDSSVPKITWGAYVDCGGSKTLGLSIEVNHKFIDGYHLGQFASKLSDLIENLEV